MRVQQPLHIRTYIGFHDFRPRQFRLLPIEECSLPVDDSTHARGAIELIVNGKPLITQAEWDDVYCLWHYLLNDMRAALQGETRSGSFPDQPIGIRLSPVHGGCAVTLEVWTDKFRRRGTIRGREELVRFVGGARSAFEWFARNCVRNDEKTHAAHDARLAQQFIDEIEKTCPERVEWT